jgi:tripartite-type tricarboxylate transporter receptor subunit TctC
LGVSSPTRLKALPAVPTISEAGLPGFESLGFIVLAAPAGTPPGIVNRLYSEVNDFHHASGVREKYDSIGYLADRSPPPEQLGPIIEKQIELWTDVVAKAGLTHSQ